MVAAERQLVHWRQKVFEFYAKVRILAQDEPASAWRFWLAERSRLYSGHSMSPVAQSERETFAGLSTYAYDQSLRFVTDIKSATGERVRYELGVDGSLTVEPFAETTELKAALGSELTLYRLIGYAGGMFLPFKDLTSGKDTYGGGRYFIDTIKGADLGTDNSGRLIVDFNFAYSPSCAWSHQFVCPLAPVKNMLSIAIEAGEKRPPAN